VRRLARVIEAELDLHSTFDKVDTGTFRAIGAPPAGQGRVPDVEEFVGPANSDRYEDGRA
jgi:2-aminoadipate transaminase